MKRFLAISLIFLGLVTGADAANRFWVPLTVTGAISGTGGLCRLTVNDTTNLTAGNAVIVAGITGALACDGTTTVTTVVDATHVEVNLAFGAAYVSGGTVAGGNWTATGTGNWSATTGGAGGQSVPGASDVVAFDASSGGGTVTVNFGGAISIQSLAISTFTGTWDNSVNNNNITMSANNGFNISGSGVRTIKLGTATYTLSFSGGATLFTSLTTTNLTYTGNAATINFTGTSGLRLFAGGGLSHGNIILGAISGAGSGGFQFTGSNTFASLSIAAPNYVTFPNTLTNVITAPFTWTGTNTSQIGIASDGINTVSTITATAGSTATWTAFRSMSFTGSPTASNSFNIGNNAGITITGPSGGGGCILGGWLLWRDMPEHLNDNFPAWLEKSA